MLSLTRALAARQDRINKDEKGFTLIELLVVVIIIGILAAIAIPIFLGQQISSRDSAVQSDITNAKIAVVAAIVSDGTFPTSLTGLADFTPGADSNLALSGDATAFCIDGYDTTNGATDHTFRATDIAGVEEGACP